MALYFFTHWQGLGNRQVMAILTAQNYRRAITIGFTTIKRLKELAARGNVSDANGCYSARTLSQFRGGNNAVW